MSTFQPYPAYNPSTYEYRAALARTVGSSTSPNTLNVTINPLINVILTRNPTLWAPLSLATRPQTIRGVCIHGGEVGGGGGG